MSLRLRAVAAVAPGSVDPPVVVNFQHKCTGPILEPDSNFSWCGMLERVVHRLLRGAVQVPGNLCVQIADRFRTIEDNLEIAVCRDFRERF